MRLKFGVFAAVALILPVVLLARVSRTWHAQAEQGARQKATAGILATRGLVESSSRHLAQLKLASVMQKQAFRDLKLESIESFDAAEFNKLRALLHDKLTPALRAQAIVGLLVANKAVMALGEEDATKAPNDFEAETAAQGGGVVLEVSHNEVPYMFERIAVRDDEKQGVAFVGLPVVPTQAELDTLRDTLGLEALIVTAGGRPKSPKGQKIFDTWSAKTQASSEGATEKGSIEQTGPLKWPMLTEQNFFGGQATVAVAKQGRIGESALLAIAVAPLDSNNAALTRVQQFAVTLLLAFFGFALLWALAVMRSVQSELVTHAPLPSAPMVRNSPPSPPKKLSAPPPDDENDAILSALSERVDNNERPAVTTHERSSDPALGSTAAETFAERDPPPIAGLPGANPTPNKPPPDDSDAVTRVQNPIVEPDPFGQLSGSSDSSSRSTNAWDAEGAEATRISSVPDELLRKSANESTDNALPDDRTPMADAMTVRGGDPDEPHFIETFEAFVRMREQCGEQTDNLSYSKFVEKLKKNREQLVAKYNCRTVKFQVYVKEGKAALKAAPVRG